MWRREKASCKVVARRRNVLSAVARARAGFEVHELARDKRVIVVGKIDGAVVRMG